MMFDAPDDSDPKSTYECLSCGEIVKDVSNPGECLECGGDMQNRAKSLE